MGEFSDEIMSLIPEVVAQHEQEEAARRAEAEARATEAEQRRLAELAATERCRTLGKEVVHLLQSNHVPTVPVYDRPRRGGIVRQVGNAWQIKLMYTPEQEERFRRIEVEYIGGTGASWPIYALQDTGVIFQYKRTLYEEDGRHGVLKGKKYEGIIFPNKPLSGQAGLDMLQSEHFMRGVAALLASSK